MLSVGDFTDTNRIRGALGLDPRDLMDQQIIDMETQIELDIELYSWFPAYATQYDTWYNSGNPSDAGQNSINLLLSYCTFYSAYLVGTTLELLVVKSITDSKMQAARFASVDFDEIKSRVWGKAQSSKVKLAEELSLSISVTTPILFSKATPGYDPVVGE